MHLIRRLSCAALFTLAFAAACAHAQNYPERPIRLIVPYPPGASTDMLSRQMADGIAERLGQRVVVENKPGGNSAIGLSSAAGAAPDGYTLATIETSFAVNPHLNPNLTYSLKSFQPVSLIGTAGLVWVVHPSVKAQTAKEFVELAQANPGKLTYGHAGTGTPPHLAPEMLKAKTGIDILAVPYKGSGPAVQDLLAGNLSTMFTGVSAVRQFVEGGKLRALAVTTRERSETMPNVPSLTEAGIRIPELEQGTWWGLVAPAGTPRAIVDKLNDAIAKTAASPAVKAQLAALNIVPLHSSPEAFGTLVANETASYAELVKRANIRAE